MTDNKQPESKIRPLVSVIIPCWGCREYIREAIESALAQTYQPIEVIVVEDCGTDGTYEEALKIKDERLRVYRNQNNLGQHRNKNQGRQLAKGSLIKYLDGDDVLEPECVDLLVRTWREAGAGVGVVFGQFIIIDEQGKYLSTPRHWGISGRCNGLRVLEWVVRKKSQGCPFGNPSPHLIERKALEAIGGFPNNDSYSGDMETFYKLLCITDVVFVADTVARYRRQPHSISTMHSVVDSVRDNVETVERLLEFFQNRADIPNYMGLFREWQVWASANFIMSNYWHKLRRLPNQYDAIRAVFVEKGLASEFDSFVFKRFLPAIWAALVGKLRKALNMPEYPPLFSSGFRRATGSCL